MDVAIILTHNRPELLRECVNAVATQVDEVIVIDNASQPAVTSKNMPRNVRIAGDWRQPPNLSRLWNVGIDLAATHSPQHIAFLCDDAIVPDGWVAAVTRAMDETGAAAGCSNPDERADHPPRLKTEHDRDLMGRMPGWAFILDASKNIRADERLFWWWCDTAIDWIARHRGGMVMISGYPVPNVRPNDFTATVPGLHDQAGQDGLVFAALYGGGRTPW